MNKSQFLSNGHVEAWSRVQFDRGKQDLRIKKKSLYVSKENENEISGKQK